MKIATWNVNSLKVRLPHVLQWLEQQQPDVLALQEIKMIDDVFPRDELAEAGYQTVSNGQPTYNGVALLSRTAIEDVVTEIPDFADPQRRVLGATIEGVRIFNLYVPNGAEVDSDKYQYKLAWLQHLRSLLAAELEQHEKLVVLGDFNIAPADIDVHDPAKWEGAVHVSPAERAELNALLDLGLVDTFRALYPETQVFSWWDYRRFAFKRNAGLRIDHILASKFYAGSCQLCAVDAEPRAWERPSDHAPVYAEFG